MGFPVCLCFLGWSECEEERRSKWRFAFRAAVVDRTRERKREKEHSAPVPDLHRVDALHQLGLLGGREVRRGLHLGKREREAREEEGARGVLASPLADSKSKQEARSDFFFSVARATPQANHKRRSSKPFPFFLLLLPLPYISFPTMAFSVARPAVRGLAGSTREAAGEKERDRERPRRKRNVLDSPRFLLAS